MSIVFLERPLVERLHTIQIQRFGGAAGLRDENAFGSALSRPVNKVLYGCEDIFELAAAYLYGLARNHTFVDGNKRIAVVAAAVFLMENGIQIATDDATLYTFVVAVAAGEIDEGGATRFLSDVSVPYSG